MEYKQFKAHAVQSGEGLALVYKLPSETKYHILCALETVPSIMGQAESIEYDVTTDNAKGKIKGKLTLEEADVSFMGNRDTYTVMKSLKNQQIQFATLNLNDWTAWKFVAEISYKQDEATSGDILKGTLHLTPSSAEEDFTNDFYDLYQDTITFESIINPSIEIAEDEVYTVNVITDPAGATCTVENTGASIATATYASGALTITGKAAGSCVITLKASLANYASNFRTIHVVVK